ncbi:MAG: dTMP kinase [Paracoccaceae bacterium]
MPGGVFVTLEGIDGSGKSTQASRLADHLRRRGLDVVRTREPGGSPGAEEIRRLLVEGDPGRWSPETEILLFTAARRDHVERTIGPALARGATVICDRFADSTRVYQSCIRADLRGAVDALHDRMIGLEPDLTIVLDMDAEAALARGLARSSGETRFETLGADFQRRARQGFRQLARDFPDRCRLVSGQGGGDAVFDRILAVYQEFAA